MKRPHNVTCPLCNEFISLKHKATVVILEISAIVGNPEKLESLNVHWGCWPRPKYRTPTILEWKEMYPDTTEEDIKRLEKV